MFERLGKMACRLPDISGASQIQMSGEPHSGPSWPKQPPKGPKTPVLACLCFHQLGGRSKKNQPNKSHFNGGGEWSSGNQAWGQRLVRVQLHGGVDVCLVVGLGDVWDAKNGKDRPQSGMMEQAVLRVTSYITYNNIIIVAIGVPLCAITIKLHGNITSYVCMYVLHQIDEVRLEARFMQNHDYYYMTLPS